MIKLGRLAGFSAKELEKFLNAFELCKLVMSTEAFRFAVEQSKFTDTKATGAFVYHQLMGANHTVNFQISTPPWYKRWLTKEIAREVTGVGVIFNRDKFMNRDLASLASTIAHEICHTASYTHTFWESPLRNGSVPYKIGYMVEELARALPKVNEVPEHLAAIESTNS